MSTTNPRTTPEEPLSDRAVELAKDASVTFAERANQLGAKGMTKVAYAVKGAADKVEEASRAPVEAEDSPVEAEHVQAVSQPLHRAASYLTEKDPRGVALDVDRAVRKHPYRTLAVGLAAGWLIGRLTGRD